jgi:hypothetical protein
MTKLHSRGSSCRWPGGRKTRQIAVAQGLSGLASSRSAAGDLVLCKPERLCYTLPAREPSFRLFLGSSAVEHSTVNRMVAGSNPARGASRGFYVLRHDRFNLDQRGICQLEPSPPISLPDIFPDAARRPESPGARRMSANLAPSHSAHETVAPRGQHLLAGEQDSPYNREIDI